MPLKVDGNQAEIVAALRKAGCSVQDLHEVGRGCPDILVGRRGRNVLMEIKMPGEPLNERQEKWWAKWYGEKYLIETADQALAAMGIGVAA